MKKSVIAFIVFTIGAALLCATGRTITLTWKETMFVLGAILATAASGILAGEIKWFEAE